jgi:TatD DNase family protein
MMKNPQRILSEAYRSGVKDIIAVSVNLDSYERTRKIRSDEVRVYPSIAIHPWEALGHSHEIGSVLEEVETSKFVGEIGLDHYFTGVREREVQLKVFDAFLQACDGTQKVLNIHSVGAEKQILKLLQRYSLRHVNMHWYDPIDRMKPLELVSDFIELGCFMSIPPAVVTGRSLRKLVGLIPLENLLTETDTHPNVKYGDVQSAPKMVSTVVDEIGKIKDVRREEVEKAISQNFGRLVG